MYCNGCGQLLEANQPVCHRCGKPVAGVPAGAPYTAPYAAPYQSVPYYRVQKHLQTIGVLWIVYAVWNVVTVLIAATLFTSMFGQFGHRWGMNSGPFDFPFSHLPWLVPLITTLAIGRGILSAVTGLALLRRAPWARTLALVTSFLTLIKPIWGTILAIYTLWALLPSASGQEYERISTP